MLISCECVNFVASSNSKKLTQHHKAQQQQKLPSATASAVVTADQSKSNATEAAVAMQQSPNDCSNITIAATTSSSNNNAIVKPSYDDNDSVSLTNALRQMFLHKYPTNFVFYSVCMEFFKQAIGPVPEMIINVVSQKDIIYSLTLEIPELQTSSATKSSWQLSICSNCKVVLFAKSLHFNPPQYLLNCGLLTNAEEVEQKRSDASFSDTFGLIIMDHPDMEIFSSSINQNVNIGLSIGSLSTSFFSNSDYLTSKQSRLKELKAKLQQRLHSEIAETDERIESYKEQQFALLKSFREKSEREYNMLVSHIQGIPEQQANEWLERQPPSFDVSELSVNLSYVGSRRRNTISSRRELKHIASSTETAIKAAEAIFNYNRQYNVKLDMNYSDISAILPGGSSLLNRKMSNIDTPPATPEAIPMSVGTSPTFRQQQHTTFPTQQQNCQQQFSTAAIETADDCLFELEGIDSSNDVTPQHHQIPPCPLRLLQSQNVPHQLQSAYSNYQRSFSSVSAQSENHMSDLEESDDAEEAEDALDLDSSEPIAMRGTPNRRLNSKTPAFVANFAKSLPIEIIRSPSTGGRKFMTTVESDEDEIGNNTDIAASIKAIAKSVHGEAMFGDLPKPRLRSQI